MLEDLHHHSARRVAIVPRSDGQEPIRRDADEALAAMDGVVDGDRIGKGDGRICCHGDKSK